MRILDVNKRHATRWFAWRDEVDKYYLLCQHPLFSAPLNCITGYTHVRFKQATPFLITRNHILANKINVKL